MQISVIDLIFWKKNNTCKYVFPEFNLGIVKLGSRSSPGNSKSLKSQGLFLISIRDLLKRPGHGALSYNCNLTQSVGEGRMRWEEVRESMMR